MGYIVLFLLLFSILYSPELFCITLVSLLAGWIGYRFGKESKSSQVKKPKVEPLEIDPDEYKTPQEKYYEEEVESSLKPEYRIKHIMKREKEKLEKIVKKYKKRLDTEGVK